MTLEKAITKLPTTFFQKSSKPNNVLSVMHIAQQVACDYTWLNFQTSLFQVLLYFVRAYNLLFDSYTLYIQPNVHIKRILN